MNNHDLTISANSSEAATCCFEKCEYIAVRPATDCGDHVADAPIYDYEQVQLQIGLPGIPTHVHEFFDTAEQAITAALAIKEKFPHLRLWYNGLEAMVEFGDWRSFAALFAEWDDRWEVVEQVATGCLVHDDPAVLEAADFDPLIALAAAKVKPK